MKLAVPRLWGKAKVVVPEAPPAPEFTIMCEDGSRIAVEPRQERSYRVHAIDGSWWDHCCDAPDGEWVYRRM